VFDGHCGGEASKFAKNNLLNELYYQESVEKAFINTERLFYQHVLNIEEPHTNQDQEGLTLRIPKQKDRSGSCALVAILKGLEVNVVGVGDCTALRILKNGIFQIVNIRHRISEGGTEFVGEELTRIANAGLHVESERVNGELEVTRAIGDFKYKGNQTEERLHAVCCIPTQNSFRIGNQDLYLLLFSDGIGDGIEMHQIVQELSLAELDKEGLIKKIKHLILLAAHESMDNCSLVCLNTQELYRSEEFLTSGLTINLKK
jgi:serine/threonine protein phosphatase PrpC